MCAFVSLPSRLHGSLVRSFSYASNFLRAHSYPLRARDSFHLVPDSRRKGREPELEQRLLPAAGLALARRARRAMTAPTLFSSASLRESAGDEEKLREGHHHPGGEIKSWLCVVPCASSKRAACPLSPRSLSDSTAAAVPSISAGNNLNNFNKSYITYTHNT